MKLRHFFFYPNRVLGFFFFLSALFLGRLDALPLLSSGNLVEEKSWALGISGFHSEKKPNLKISGTDAIQIPLSGGSGAVFSSGNVEIETELETEAAFATLAVRPSEGFEYQFRLGQIQKFHLEYSSGSQVNSLENIGRGLVYGFGVSGRITPGSIVSTAISWKIDITEKLTNLDRFQGGETVASSSIKAEEREIQASVNFSRRWKTLEPYGGIKLMKTDLSLKDTQTKQKVRGSVAGVSPFVGLQWSMAQRESILIEASFLEEKSFSAAMKVNF